ncbi:5'-nucleotidase, lipoprotein e(P4) family [Terrimonas sp.]|uniref:5'-nucleotidase, lipoprotein e(P4) family n=1 Tax=Terrimonas sp. TaxID=1914338 RepID=UPI000D51EDA4|nr:5'-nucleotidase, lipoprotein e(P4) family [Terrimonas sp.]PVD53296.1 5'-nucleotidase, lipoprotein e(P4) family [Terrimonas sp.]
MRIKYSIAICVAVLVISCKVQRSASTNITSPSLVTQGPLWGAVWQQKASEYKALCFQAYNTARLQLDMILKEPQDKPLALVTDIDETILDNSPYQVHSSLKNEEYSDSSWIVWTKRVDCDTVPGGLSFFQYAKSKGVSVFYITNRLEEEREQTLKDLQRWNFPDATNDHLILKTAGSGKGPRRDKVAANYKIVMLFGDNLSDFSSVFDKKPQDERDNQTRDNAAMFGSKFIVLPNIMYGDWEGALYNYRHALPAGQKDSIITANLRKY